MEKIRGSVTISMRATLCATICLIVNTAVGFSKEPVSPVNKAQQPKLVVQLKQVNKVASVAFSPDGRLLATSGEDIKFWDTATGKLRRTLKGDGKIIRAIAFSPDGKTLAVANLTEPKPDHYTSEVTLRDAVTGELQKELETSELVSWLRFSEDGAVLAGNYFNGATSSQGPVMIWQTKTGKLRRTFPAIYAFALSPAGQTMAVSDMRKGLLLLDTRSSKLLRNLKKDDWITSGITISPDGKIVAGVSSVVESNNKSVPAATLWNVSTGKALQELKGRSNFLASWASFSSDGKKLIASAGDFWMAEHSRGKGELIMWDVASGRLLWTHPTNDVAALTYSLNKDLLAFITKNDAVEIWRFK